MAKRTRTTAADFTVAELKAMLTAKTKIDELTAKRDALATDLAKVEAELAGLLGGVVPGKPARKKASKKAAAKASAAAPKRGTPKKATRAEGRAKKATGAATKRAAAKGAPTIESVVVDLIKANGGKMAFQEVLATIQKKKLIKTKAKDFANVLRRTISTSEKIKRTGRGVYSA